MMMVALAFKVEDRIDDMFEHFGAGDCPFLSDMADEKNRNAEILGEH